MGDKIAKKLALDLQCTVLKTKFGLQGYFPSTLLLLPPPQAFQSGRVNFFKFFGKIDFREETNDKSTRCNKNELFREYSISGTTDFHMVFLPETTRIARFCLENFRGYRLTVSIWRSNYTLLTHTYKRPTHPPTSTVSRPRSSGGRAQDDFGISPC